MKLLFRFACYLMLVLLICDTIHMFHTTYCTVRVCDHAVRATADELGRCLVSALYSDDLRFDVISQRMASTGRWHLLTPYLLLTSLFKSRE